MSYCEWSNDMAVGIEQIDRLQEELTGCANRLFEALASRTQPTDRLGDVLLKLDQACSHAEEAEEELQRRFGERPDIARPAYHRDFERRIGRLLERHQADEDVALETLQLLADWLAYHQALGLGAWRELVRSSAGAPAEPKVQQRLNS